MSAKLAEEREKARRFLQIPQNNQPQSPGSFNLSDLRQDKTLYMEKTPNKSGSTPFDTKEISARSTTFNKPNQFSSTLDFDEIMRTSCSQAVRNKYRESMSMGRLSKTTDISQRNSMASSSHKMDIWDGGAQQSFSSFIGKNLTYSNEDFRPAEEMAQQLEKDEREQQMQYATIPVERARETSNWEDSMARGRLPEMSFGQVFNEKYENDNIRDIYGKESPKKKPGRVALVELTSNECAMEEDPSIPDPLNLEQFIKSYKSPQAANLIRKFGKSLKQQSMAMQVEGENKKPNSSMICDLMGGLNFENILKKAELERSRMAIEEEKNRTKMDIVPVKDDTVEGSEVDDDSMEGQKYIQHDPLRGLKRPNSPFSNDTPTSALGKCFRTKSPSKNLEVAAAKLKPKILPNESVFKVPYPSNSTLKTSLASSGVSSMSKSPSHMSSYKANSVSSSALPQNSSPSTREYVTAKDNFSMRSPDEKLSLPNYALQRPNNATMVSPSSSVRSIPQWSPTDNVHAGQLRRSASQMSSASDFGDDNLPIKIKNLEENRKISFESVKIDKFLTKNLSIQNGCDRKLSLRVRVIGSGFSVTPKEDFRMLPMEARTFQIKFSPNIIGPARGQLVFELTSNKNCSKTITLYGYGGHASISIEGVQKGPFGPQFLTMGIAKELNYVLEKKIRLKNSGTLPSFASIMFEKTKMSDFTMLHSLTAEPTQMKIDPGQYVDVRVRYKATKAEIRKIVSMKKEVTTIGEICIICGDEPTRLRILKARDVVDRKFLEYIPKSLPGETEILAKLFKFNEMFTREKVSAFMSSIKTHEVALTINRDMDDTQFISAEISLADDTHMSFETFVDANSTRINTNIAEQTNFEMYESNYFQIFPSSITFNRSKDPPGTQKHIEIHSTSKDDLFIETISSHPKFVSVSLSRGRIKFGERAEVQVTALSKAFEHHVPITIIIIIRNARIEVPVNFEE